MEREERPGPEPRCRDTRWPDSRWKVKPETTVSGASSTPHPPGREMALSDLATVLTLTQRVSQACFNSFGANNCATMKIIIFYALVKAWRIYVWRRLFEFRVLNQVVWCVSANHDSCMLPWLHQSILSFFSSVYARSMVIIKDQDKFKSFHLSWCRGINGRGRT